MHLLFTSIYFFVMCDIDMTRKFNGFRLFEVKDDIIFYCLDSDIELGRRYFMVR